MEKKLCSMNKTLVGTEESARGVSRRCSENKALFKKTCAKVTGKYLAAVSFQ